MTVHRKTLQAQGIQWALLLPRLEGAWVQQHQELRHHEVTGPVREGAPPTVTAPQPPPQASPGSLLVTSRLCMCAMGQLSTPGRTIRAKCLGPRM